MRRCNGHGPNGNLRCLNCGNNDDDFREGILVMSDDAASTEYTDPPRSVVRIPPQDRTPADKPQG